MAKKLNILKVDSKVPFADNGLKLSKTINLNIIEMHEKFQNLFEIKNDVLDRIINSMTESYDNSQPIQIWKQPDESGNIHYYLIDGYTRFAAAKTIGLNTIPCYEHQFEDFEQAYKYVLGLQVNRRNLDSSELIKNIRILLGTEFIQNSEGKKAEAIASALGVSTRTAEKTLSVLNNADDETLQAIEDNKLTVNQAYKKNHPKIEKMEKDEYTEDLSESDSTEDTSPDDLINVSTDLKDDEDEEVFTFNPPEETAKQINVSTHLKNEYDEAFNCENKGNPKGIIIHSRNMDEHLAEHIKESDYDKKLITQYKAGYVDGFKKAVAEATWLLYEKIITIEPNLKDDNLFEDFSFNIISQKLEIPTEDELILQRYNK